MAFLISAHSRESGDLGVRPWVPALAAQTGFFAAIVMAAMVAAASAGVLDDNYSIMKEEPNPPGVVNRYKSPRGSKQKAVVPRPTPDQPRRIPAMPPPIVNPQTGQLYPNLPPPVPGSGPGGRETGQDRAMRCQHQAGVYGQTGGNYIASCINQ